MGYRGYLVNPKKADDFVCLGKCYTYSNEPETIETAQGLKYLNTIGKGKDDDVLVGYGMNYPKIIVNQEQAREFIKNYELDCRQNFGGSIACYMDEIEKFINKHKKILIEGV